MKIQKVNMISERDWSDFVKTTYKRPYQFQQQNGCMERGTFNFTVPSKYTEDFKRDTVPEEVNHRDMGVSFKAWLERDPEKLLPDGRYGKCTTDGLQMWWERNFYPDIHMIINDLHSKGLLEDGDYVIDIDW